MGRLALAAKLTHVPSMYLSELDGPRKGTRQDAIDGHAEIGRRCRALGVDTLVVFDTHWLVNANYHINCADQFEGRYTSNELPHFISNMAYGFPGNPELGQLLARKCNEFGVETLAHERTTLAPEYGTLVPMRDMNADRHFKVVSVSALCMAHYLNDSARLGWAMRRAIEDDYDGTVAVFASGSLSHRFAQNGLAPEFAFKIWSPFLEALDREVIRIWQAGDWKTFCGMLPEYAAKGHGEGFMHDTAMLLGAGMVRLRRQSRGRHALLRRIRHRADQRRVPGDAADRQCDPACAGIRGRGLHRSREPPLANQLESDPNSVGI